MSAAPIIKYKTGGWALPIERVECTRESPAYVFFMRAPLFGRGQEKEVRAKKRDGEIYHASWEFARAYLLDERVAEIAKSQGRIRQEAEKIEKAREQIEIIKGWTQPEDKP